MTRRLLVVATSIALFAANSSQAQATDSAPWRDSHLPVATRVHDLLGRMTLEEKFWQLFMIPGDLDKPSEDYSHGVFGLQISATDTSPLTAARSQAIRINAIQRYFVERTRLGIPIIPFDEAVHGLMREGATNFPSAIALAATFDTALMSRVATAVADETGSRGIRQVLSPVINIASDVRWGRVEETYGEDPVLTSLMARAFIRPFEQRNIITTPKHLIANVGEGGRDSYPIDIDQRLLDEQFYPPFVSSFKDAHARSVMSAYNSVDGDPATQSHALLTDKLRSQWGFGGFVISDASATGGSTVLHHTEATTASATVDAFNAGLDVVFQSSWDQYRPYYDAFRRGLISDSVINAAVTRVLTAKFELGLFEHPYVDVDSAASLNGNAAHRALALEASRSSIVLLKNDRGILPLKKSTTSIAVIGVDATETRTGGYSGAGIKRVSVLDGIRTTLGTATRVRYAPGPGRLSPEYVAVPAKNLATKFNGRDTAGLSAEYFDNNRLDGQPRLTRLDAQVSFGWTLNSPGGGIPYDWYSARWTGAIIVPKGGVKQIGVEGNDGYRLYVDGKLIIDNWKKQSYGSTLVPVAFVAGTRHAIRLEYFESTGNAKLKLIWDAGVAHDWSRQIDSAVSIARKSEVAIVVAGIEEGEFRDRALLGLPGHQEELIRRVAATGTPVVVVLSGGSAITMPWLSKVKSVVDVWYPGEEGGQAVADILFGTANPAGRLPITFPISEGQLPLHYSHKPTGRGDDYVDLTGQPLFPFGFGLSYTTFEYSNLRFSSSSIARDGATTVSCRVTNTGAVAGDEVVQLYIRDELTSVAQPLIALKGISRIHLNPGESREVTFALGRDELQLLNREMKWVVEPGTFRIMIGASSKDIRLRGILAVQ